MKRSHLVLASVMLLAIVLLATACSEADPPQADVAASTTVAQETETTVSSATTTATPTTTDGPTDVGLREVTFVSGDLQMTGTLRVPAAVPAPAVVLIHGSGPNNRDAISVGQLNLGFGFEIPVFAEIGEALREAGFVVLSYDKRTCGPFNGCAENGYPLPADDLLVDAFMVDAQAAVTHLRDLPEVDPDRVSVVGHSQGAEFIPLMLEADPQLARGAMLAGPFRPIDQIMEFQFTSSVELMETLGMTQEQAIAAPGMADLRAMLVGLAEVRAGSEAAVGGVSAEFWASWFDLGQRRLDAALNISQPLLILGGDFDWNVPAEEVNAWADHLAAAGVDHTALVLPCVTHALNCVTERDINAIRADNIGAQVAPEVLEAIVSFLTE